MRIFDSITPEMAQVRRKVLLIQSAVIILLTNDGSLANILLGAIDLKLEWCLK